MGDRAATGVVTLCRIGECATYLSLELKLVASSWCHAALRETIERVDLYKNTLYLELLTNSFSIRIEFIILQGSPSTFKGVMRH